jgi:hypothetical protein
VVLLAHFMMSTMAFFVGNCCWSCLLFLHIFYLVML